MSYEVLARKYRPTNFEEVVGQDHIIKALSNSILQDRMHQAFIFSGTRGVGKTTLGRILAKCLNCLSSENPVNSPCDKCSNCEEIKLGRSLDFYEQDAASQRGIDAMKGGEDDNVAVYTGSTKACVEGKHPEDEHRVFYVAVTRARNALFIIESDKKYRYYL